MTYEFWLQLFSIVIVAAATYGAIRKDIENIHERLGENSKQIDQAHRRIDDILMQRNGE